jgi:hypothetical protein
MNRAAEVFAVVVFVACCILTLYGIAWQQGVYETRNQIRWEEKR